MYRVLVVMLLLCSPLTVFAAPAIVVDNLKYDFGQVTQSEQVETVYRFQNSGDEVLVISQVRSSCGCTAALLTQSRLEPGAVGELKVRFDSSGFRGAVHKYISFNTNDPRHATLTFDLQGTVMAPFYVAPDKVNWGRVAAGTPLSASLKIVNASGQAVTLSAPETTLPQLHLTIDKLILAPGEEALLNLESVFPQDQKRLAGYVIVRSDFSQLPMLKIPVSARLQAN